jgi:hypothetical protein
MNENGVNFNAILAALESVTYVGELDPVCERLGTGGK